MNILGQLILTFGVLSLLSIGGANATIPEIHRQIVDQLHWMDDATFAGLVAIGQTAPGPNVLTVSMIGWHMAGVLGLLAASFAIVLPSSVLALGLGRVMERYAALDVIAVARLALAPIAVGLMLASGVVMTRAAYKGSLSGMIVVAVATMVYTTRASPLWGIAAGATAGMVGQALHVFG